MVKITKILCALVVLGALPASANAVPTIDGRFEPGEGYTTGYYVNFEVEGGKNQPLIPVSDQGQLWKHQDASGNLYVAFIQPVTLVDNSYGANAVGWGSYAPSGKNHKFQELIGSDKAQFVFTDGLGTTVLDITMDYIHGYGNKKEDPPYASGGVVDGEGKVTVGSVGDVIEWATSLQYNWDTFGSSYPGYFGKDSDSPATGSQDPAAANCYDVMDPSLSDWVFEVTYEFRVDGSLFAENGFGGLTIPILHDSPNKIGKNKVYPQVDGVIPEPTTIALLSIGTSLVGWLRRRKTL